MGLAAVVRMARLCDRLALLPDICRRAAAEGAAPGGVLLVGRGEDTLAEFPFGDRTVAPEREPATLDTIYDLASLTKPIITATLFMQAVEDGLINLMEPIGRWLPIPKENPVAEAMPYHLLLHTSGLPAGRPLPPGDVTPEVLVGAMTKEGLVHPPGTAFIYSDVGYHLLACVLERLYDAPLADLARRRVLCPLGMCDTDYGVAPEKLARCAPTESVEGTCLRGVVHDPAARQMGGVAGHAGLFGTAHDLARYCRMILRRGECAGGRIMEPATLDRMIAPVEVPGGKRRALGWDVDTQYSSPRGELLPARGVGHTGYTGTSLWVDPPTGLFIILLTNRVHPDGHGDVVRLRRLAANVVAAAVLP